MHKFVITAPNAHRIADETDEAKGGGNLRYFVFVEGMVPVEGETPKVAIQVASDTYDGPPINDSHPCPGSPGC